MALTAEQIRKIAEDPDSVKTEPTKDSGSASPFIQPDTIRRIAQETDDALAKAGEVPAYTYKDLKSQAQKNWEAIGLNFLGGLNDAGDSLAQTMKSGAEFLREGSLTGKYLLNKPLTAVIDTLDKMHEGAEYQRKVSAEANAEADSAVQMLNNWVTRPVASSLPNTVLALMTGGSSEAARIGTKGAGIVSSLSQQLLKNPQFYASAAQTFGPTYYDAKESGATDDQAMWTALLNSALGAVIEVGATPESGGLESYLKSNEKSFLDFVKSIPEEGKEEVLQGALERLLQKTVAKNDDVAWFSTDPEQEAVLNPATSAQEFLGGVIVGGVLGGTTYTVNAVINNVNDVKMRNGVNYAALAMDTAGKTGVDTDVSADVANIAYATKTPVVWVDALGNTPDGGMIRGVFKDGVVVLAKNAAADANTVAAHELTHSIEGTAAYQNIVNEIDAERKSSGRQSVDEEAAALQALYKDTMQLTLSPQEAKSEVVAMYVEKRMDTSPAALAAMRGYNGGILSRFLQNRLYNRQYAAADAETQQKMQLQRNMSEGLRQRKKASLTPDQIRSIAESVEAGDMDGARYSRNGAYDYSKSFEEQLKDYQNGNFPRRDSLIIGETPEVFRKIGFNALPMTINQAHVYDALNGTRDADHTFGMSLLKTLPDALQHPVAVITSQTQNGTSVVALLEMQVNGKTVVAPVTIDGFAIENGIRIDSNAVTSVYGKGGAITNLLANAIREEQNGNVGVYYIDKNKAAGLLQRGGLQLPTRLFRTDGYIHSIRDSDSPVKPKFENVTQSQQFKRWFGDWQKNPNSASKVVNADGTPKVVYHGTNSKDFYVFDSSRSDKRVKLNTLGDGYYFTSEEETAKRYGERVMALYLDIKKPYRVYARDGGIRAQMADDFHMDADSISRNDIQSILRANGYDGVLLYRSKYDADSDFSTAVAFSNTQIKSATDNIGTFDRTNPDIRYSLSGINSGNVEELLAPYIKQYGGMELPGREIEVPKSVEEGTFVSRAASTLLNDPKIKGNEEAKGVGIRGIVEGDYNRKRMNLDEALRKSKESIEKLGYDNVVAEMRDRITDGSVLNEREMARYMTLREEAIAAGDWDAVQDCNVLIANSLTSSARNMTLARRLLEGLDGEHTAKADQRALESRNEKAAERARKERGNVPQETIDRMRGKKAEMEKDYRQAETESTEKRNAVRDLRRHLNDLQKGIDQTVSDQKRTDKQTPKLAKQLAQKMQDAVAATDSLITSEEKFQKTKQELHDAKMELNRLKRQTKANERAEYQYLWDMLLVNERLETAVEEQRQSAEKLRETKKELDRSKEYRKLKEDLQKLGAGIEIPQAMWDELKAAKTPEEIEAAQARIFKEAADQLPPTRYERFMSWRYLAMLGNPKTWIKNEVGNLANYGLHKLDDTIAYALQKFFLKEGNRIVALNWRHTDEGKAIMDKVNEAADAATEREGSHKYTDVQSQIQDYRKRFNSNFLEKMSDGLDTALNEGSVTALTGGRVKLGAGDKPMFRANYVEALGNYMVANSLAEVTAEADAYATKVAQDYVFHTQNIASELLTKFRNSGKVQKIIVDSLMPFIRTPANVLAQGLQRSPIGFAAAATKLAKAFAAQKRGTGSVTPDIINNMARSTTGAVLFTLGVLLSAVGVASGDEEGDDAKGRAAGELSGAQDLSFNILGTRISFDWLEPASYPFLLGVLMQDGFSQDNPVGSLLDAASAGFGQVFEMSMLSGVLNAVNSNYGDAGDSVAQAVTSVFENAATQSIPTLVGQLARAVDPVKRKTTSGESWITDVLGKNIFSDTASTLAARIPGLSKTLEPERDVWGNEVGRVGDAQAMLLNAFQQLLSPAAIKVKGSNGEQADDLSAILADLYEKTEQGKVIPTELKAKDFKKKLDDEGLMDRYTSTLYQETREDVGKAQLEALWEMIDQNKAVKLTKTYKTANGEKKRESYTKRFADMDDTEKAKAVQKTAQDAKKELLEELLLELEKGAKKT